MVSVQNKQLKFLWDKCCEMNGNLVTTSSKIIKEVGTSMMRMNL